MAKSNQSDKSEELGGGPEGSEFESGAEPKARSGVGSGAQSGAKLVIVESPTKARTIRKFLGKDFMVESCMGHVRDLPQSAKEIPTAYRKETWASLGVNTDKGFEPIYCVPKNKVKVVSHLKKKLAEASELYLATDEDREGESISWHLVEVLKPKIPQHRMVFNEITASAIQRALKETRRIDFHLVRAQEARRILDRLVGYSLSPLLWKKIAFGLSAGRVQSVALRLVCEKELQRLQFVPSEYASIRAQLRTSGTDFPFESHMVVWKGQRLATGKDFDGTTGALVLSVPPAPPILHLKGGEASEVMASLEGRAWVVSEIDEKPIHRKPPPPFITSTLQQEANRKLGLSSRETMQIAQKLYEQGFITYMRTDSNFLSQEALQAARGIIGSLYGAKYLPSSPRTYEGKKARGAQEAHEAIRPSGIQFQAPEETGLSGVFLKLYEMIWKRTVASQMVDALQKQVHVKFRVGEEALFSSSGMTIEFPGFLRVYVEGSDDPEAELAEREVRLPSLQKGQEVKCQSLTHQDHSTKPPARYTEASLVQTMEREGIGRPSTYASILGTIMDRGYVRKQGNALVPTFTALAVSQLLGDHLPQYVDLKFTSEMEESLDSIAEGNLDSESYLEEIYFGRLGLKAQVENQEKKIDADKARSILLKGLEKFLFRVGKYGAYLSVKDDQGGEIHATVPESLAPADLNEEVIQKLIDQKLSGGDALGKDPETGLPVYLLTGRYGPYVQLGDLPAESGGGEEKQKVKRAPLPPGVSPDQVDLTKALSLLSLPKLLGRHPEKDKEIRAGIGRFGPYVVCDGDFRSVPKTKSIFDIGLGEALELLNQPKRARKNAKTLSAEIELRSGPYGFYLRKGKKNYSVPEGRGENLSLEEAEKIIAEASQQMETGKGDRTPTPRKTKKEGDLSRGGTRGRKAGPKTVVRKAI